MGVKLNWPEHQARDFFINFHNHMSGLFCVAHNIMRLGMWMMPFLLFDLQEIIQLALFNALAISTYLTRAVSSSIEQSQNTLHCWKLSKFVQEI
jgi:hypothetical protein